MEDTVYSFDFPEFLRRPVRLTEDQLRYILGDSVRTWAPIRKCAKLTREEADVE